MLNVHRFCACAMVVLLSTAAVFAGENLDNDIGYNGLEAQTSAYTVNKALPTVTVSSTADISSGGAAMIAVYGDTPSGTESFLVESLIGNNGGDSLCGVIGNFDVNTISGYVFGFSFENGRAYLATQTLGSSDTEVESTGSYATNVSYTLRMAYDGSTLSGYIYDAGDQLLETLSYSETTYNSGSSGIFAKTNYTEGGSAQNNTKGIFTNYNVVPEPMTVALFGIGAASLLARRKRK